MGQVRRSVHKGMQEIGYKEKREDFRNLRNSVEEVVTEIRN